MGVEGGAAVRARAPRFVTAGVNGQRNEEWRGGPGRDARPQFARWAVFRTAPALCWPWSPYWLPWQLQMTVWRKGACCARAPGVCLTRKRERRRAAALARSLQPSRSLSRRANARLSCRARTRAYTAVLSPSLPLSLSLSLSLSITSFDAPLCSTCAALAEFVPSNLGGDTLAADCRACCTQDAPASSSSTPARAHSAVLEVCDSQLRRHAHIQGFLDREVKQFGPGKVTHLPRWGMPPRLLLQDETGAVLETVRIDGWKTEQIVEFLGSRLTAAA